MIKRDIALEKDKCSICDRVMPAGATILRKLENNNIICILCLVEIAEIAQHERPAAPPA
jgi:hypothetical protein